MNKRVAIVLGPVLLIAGLIAGCESSLVPLKPIQRVETWEPVEGEVVASIGSQPATATAPASQMAATGPASQSATQVAGTASSTEPATVPATGPATRPMRKVVKVIDPNETVRFVYRADYDRVWQESMLLLARTGFILDRRDYRLGILTTQPLPSAQIIEFWKPEHTDALNAMENTINSQRRSVRITISKVPNKPEFYAIGIEVLVERETNPSEKLGGPMYTEGSGFGRASVSLGSDYAPPVPEKPIWIRIGHDPKLERKLLDQLFDKI